MIRPDTASGATLTMWASTNASSVLDWSRRRSAWITTTAAAAPPMRSSSTGQRNRRCRGGGLGSAGGGGAGLGGGLAVDMLVSGWVFSGSVRRLWQRPRCGAGASGVLQAGQGDQVVVLRVEV